MNSTVSILRDTSKIKRKSEKILRHENISMRVKSREFTTFSLRKKYDCFAGFFLNRKIRQWKLLDNGDLDFEKTNIVTDENLFHLLVMVFVLCALKWNFRML